MANKYGGLLIYESKDELGPIEVIEFKQAIRTLHFGNDTQQTAMFLYNSVVLIHKYSQAILTPLCWLNPQKVLILGLGAGSIAKYLLNFYPDIHLNSVDLRPEVIKIAHQYFNLPNPDKNFKIYTSSAEDYLNTQSKSNYDLILVDLFLTSKGKDITVDISKNIEQFSDLLKPSACLCINIIGCEYINYPALDKLRSIFHYNIYAIPVEQSNVILICSNSHIPVKDLSIDFTTIEKNLGLPLKRYFNQMIAV